MSRRPSVTLIVPFAGSDAELVELRRRLDCLALAPGDQVIVADNRSHPLHTPAFARNCGARGATGEWLVFIDADTVPQAGLLDGYFDPPPSPATAVLAGGIHDAQGDSPPLVARYVHARAQMGDSTTLQRAGRPYAQTANCAVRRSAFLAVGGFEERARAGEDADLCFRLAQAGWGLEQRPAASVRHLARRRFGGWLAQLVVHGSGAAWLERRWPGEFPAPPPGRFAARLARHLQAAVRAAARGRAEEAAFSLLDLAGACAFALGRLIPNLRRPRRVGRRTRGKPRMTG